MKKGITTTTLVLLIVAVIVIAGVGYYYFTLPPPVEEELLFGAAVSQTGSYGPAGKGILDGYLLWEKDVNERGGILGRKVRLITYDDKSDPTTTKSLYERLITEDEVDFLLGPYSSACGFAMASVAEQYGLITLHPINNARKLYDIDLNGGWKYQVMVTLNGITDLQQQAPAFELLSSLSDPPETIGLINTADVYPRGVADGVIYYADKYGMDIIFHEEIEKGTTDVSAVVLKLKDADPDVVFYCGYFPDESLLVRTTQELGYKPKAMQAWLCLLLWPSFVANLGSQANYAYGSTAYMPDYPFAENIYFVEKFRAEYDKDPTVYEALAWGACKILEKAITEVGSWEDQDAIMAWLTTNSVDIPSGTWKVDQQMAAQGIRYVPEVFSIIDQIQNQIPVHVWPLEYADEDFIYPIP